MLALWILAAALASPCDDARVRIDSLQSEGICTTVAWGQLRETDPGCGLFEERGQSAERTTEVMPPRRGAGKTLRMPYDQTGLHVVSSTNFAVWWGDAVAITESQMQALMGNFEQVWAAEVDAMGYLPPAGTETYLFNVFIGSSSAALPDVGGGAYFTYDSEGHPMVVAHHDMVSADITGVAAHEFFHALQDAADSYAYSGSGAWLHEASANWMPLEVFPDEHRTHDSLWAVLMRPDLPINFFKYPEAWTPLDIHQYGAWVFVQYVDEELGGPTMIRDWWLNGPTGSDPLEVLPELVDAELGELFEDFAVKSATWDYEYGALHQAQAEQVVADEPDARWIAGTLRPGDADWVEAPWPLQSLGMALWRLEGVSEGSTIRLGGDQSARWQVAWVTQSGAEHIEVSGATAVEIRGAAGYDEGWLVVTLVTESVDAAEYDYRLRVEVPVVEPEAVGCSCATARHRAWWLALWPTLWIGRRRRSSCGRRLFR